MGAAGQPDAGLIPAERLLLLLPACADRAQPGTAAQTVADALAAVGAGADARRIAEALLGGPGSG